MSNIHITVEDLAHDCEMQTYANRSTIRVVVTKEPNDHFRFVYMTVKEKYIYDKDMNRSRIEEKCSIKETDVVSLSYARDFLGPELKTLVNRWKNGDDNFDTFYVEYVPHVTEATKSYNYVSNEWSHTPERLCASLRRIQLLKNGKLNHPTIPADISIGHCHTLQRTIVETMHFYEAGKKTMCREIKIPSWIFTDIFLDVRDNMLRSDWGEVVRGVTNPKEREQKKFMNRIAKLMLTRYATMELKYYWNDEVVSLVDIEQLEWPLEEHDEFTLNLRS